MQGNKKLGDAVHVWSIPAIATCPGSTPLCRAVCYATQHRFRFAGVHRRLQWNWNQCRRADFVERMVAEIRTRGVLVLRLHVAGDFWNASYAERWLRIMRRAPRVRYFGYTRSWRVSSIAPVLEVMAALPCVRLWYSIDDHTGRPPLVPAGVRLAYLQTTPHPVGDAELVFRVRRYRRQPACGAVCPHETAAGQAAGITCGSCARCFE